MRGMTLSLVWGRCLLGVEFLAKRPGDSVGWGKDGRGSHVAIERKETTVGSVSRGDDVSLN